MINNSIRMPLALLAGLLPPLALAHPDHPHTLGFADSFTHLFSSPDHLLLLLLSVAAAIVFGREIVRWLRNR